MQHLLLDSTAELPELRYLIIDVPWELSDPSPGSVSYGDACDLINRHIRTFTPVDPTIHPSTVYAPGQLYEILPDNSQGGELRYCPTL